MTAAIAMLSWCICFVSAIGTGGYLVLNGHPWIGLFTIIIGGLLSVKTGKAAEN